MKVPSKKCGADLKFFLSELDKKDEIPPPPSPGIHNTLPLKLYQYFLLPACSDLIIDSLRIDFTDPKDPDQAKISKGIRIETF